MSVVNIKPIVYIIVPIYNVAPYLSRCFDSLLVQTYENIRIIAIDDGSKDNSGEICDEYAKTHSQISVVHQMNKGLSGARNAGIRFAISEAGDNVKDCFISFIDSDDYIHPEMIDSLVSLFKTNDSISIAGIDAQTVGAGKVVDYAKVDLYKTVEYSFEEFAKQYLIHEASVSVCNKLFRLSLFQKIQFVEGKLNEDGLLLYEMFVRYQCRYIHLSIPMYFYFVREGSISNSGFGKSIVDMIYNFLKIEELTEEYLPQLKKEANDNILYACATFCNTIPLSCFLYEYYDVSSVVIQNVRNRKKTINHALLKSRDKAMLKCFSIFPRLTIIVISFYRYAKRTSKGRKTA